MLEGLMMDLVEEDVGHPNPLAFAKTPTSMNIALETISLF